MHVSATLSDACRTIRAFFFFDSKEIPQQPEVGDKLRLIGTQLQEWRGRMQLGGKNIRFGDPIVSMSLSDAVAAWNAVKQANAQRYFPKLAMLAVVIVWGNAKISKGA